MPNLNWAAGVPFSASANAAWRTALVITGAALVLVETVTTGAGVAAGTGVALVFG